MLVHLEGADKYYGARRVLADVTVTVRKGAKVGVVGPNGGGKSTLLRLLAGMDPLDGGRRETARDVRVGWLGQLVAFAPEHEVRTVGSYLRDALQDVDELAARVEALERELERSDGQSGGDAQAEEERLARTLERYAEATARFEQAGGYEADARLRATAFGLGFEAVDLEKQVGTLSGGQKVRLALARLLLAEPDVLLLDEPTNHLDTGTTEWLESFLQRAPQAVVVVSHDRWFLDAVTEQTWDVDGGAVAVYPAPYTRAQALKLEALQRQHALHERQQAEIRRLEQFVERYRAGIKARQARGRAARLARIQPVGPPAGAVYDAAAAVDGAGTGRRGREVERAGGGGARGASAGGALSGRRGPRFGFTDAEGTARTGREALRATDVMKGFGRRPVLAGVNVVAERGQRIGVIGPNGSGKTTLLRMLAGELQPDEGLVTYGSGVRLGYFAQGQEDLDPELTVVEHLLAENDLTVEEARGYLARFLFFGDEIDAPVGRLSGGERNRVALARLILRRPNVLLLDEPTNHLDVSARIALEGALAEFDGVIVAVSHDRYFLESVCERLWIVDGGQVDVFVGAYSQWAEAKAQMDREGDGLTVHNPSATAPASEPSLTAAEHRLRQQAERRQRQRERRRRRELTSEIARVEREIEQLEAKQRELEGLLADPGLYADEERAKETVLAHRNTVEALAERMERWEALLTEAETLAP